MKPGPRPSMSDESPAELVEHLSHPNGWWRDTAQQLLVQRGEKSVAPTLRELAVSGADWRTKLHALWTLDGIDEIDTATVGKALGDTHADVRAAAVRLSERWLREGEHPLRAAVLSRMDDPNWIVRRQLAASLGELPAAARVGPIVEMLERYGEDPIVVDAAVSGLAGQEAAVLQRMLDSKAGKAKTADAIAMLAAAVANSKSDAETQRIFERSAEPERTLWQRLALLRGVDTALGGGDRSAGGFGGLAGTGGFGDGSDKLEWSREPASIKTLAGGSGELAELARDILERANWPGRPAPADDGPALTADEEALVAAGAEVYTNTCAGCHLENGQGAMGGRTNLAASKMVAGNPNAVMRLVLGGKDSEAGLMPPLGGSLNDEQIAAVVSYIRRAWGHRAFPVTAADVQETRGVTSLRKAPWTDKELEPFTRGRFRGAPARRP